MKRILVFPVISTLLFFTLSAYADVDFSSDTRDEVVGLFGVLLTPSIFTSASPDKTTLLVYGRTLTEEGKVPDFDGDIEDEIDEMAIFAGARIGGLGLTLGFGEKSNFEFSEPIIASIDYKACLTKEPSQMNAALDVQYTVIALTEEEKIKVSTTGFGVISVSGIVSVDLSSLVEPYVGLTFHYVYLNSDEGEELIRSFRLVPRAGLQLTAFSPLVLGGEVKFIDNESLKSAWMWDVGIGLRF